MADEYYPVICFDIPDGHSTGVPADDDEPLGSKEKFWRVRSDGAIWLFKKPRPGTGEAWAEKIAYEIATLIGVSCAEVQLAKSAGDFGAASLSFAQPGWPRAHGNTVLSETIAGYDENLRFGQYDHNIRNIASSVTRWAERNQLDPRVAHSGLVSYAVLDGLIGNTDRHHENWMFFYDPERRAFRLGPSYDHGSSLGRELQDVSRRISRSRRHILDSDGVLNYLLNRRSGGSVHANRHSKQAPPPLRTAQLICRWQPDVARPWLEQLRAVANTEFQSVIDKVPPAFMSDTAKEFAYQVMAISKAELLRSIR
jgi:hypothetical protein